MKKKLIGTWITLKELSRLEAGDEETQRVLANRVFLVLAGKHYEASVERSKESRKKYRIVLTSEETDRFDSKEVVEKIRGRVMRFKGYEFSTKPNVRGYERKEI